MNSQTHFANIILSHECPMGKEKVPSRKKGDWFHSICVLCNHIIFEMKKGDKFNCKIIHFFGEKGSPVLDQIDSKISYVKEHKGKTIYMIDCWPHSYGVIGDIRTEDGYKDGYGISYMSMNNVTKNAFSKWGNNKIPYTHQYSESYNCVAFVDDILYFLVNNTWNKRIESNHIKFGLYL